jgi:hypothetical protein
MASVEENLGGELHTVVHPIEKLAKLHTKQLLKIFRDGYYHATCSCGSPWCDHDAQERAPYYKIRWQNLENIKRILATREHIPSKAESKRARIARIKRGR